MTTECKHSAEDEPDRATSAYPPQDCHRSVWNDGDEDYCILHSPEKDKPPSDVADAIAEECGPVTGVQLRGISDGSTLDLSGESLPRINFAGSDLSHATFDGALLDGADFSETKLDSATFIDDTYLRNAIFDDAHCVQTKFHSSYLKRASFHNASLVDVHLWGITASKIEFNGSSLEEVKLHQSHLDDAKFIDATLRETSFNRSKLTGATFSEATILDCDFTEAELSNSRFSSITIDDKTTFGSRILLEYIGNRSAEPQWLLNKYDIPLVDNRGFGVQTDPNSNPPDQSFPDLNWRTHWRFCLLSSVYRLYSRADCTLSFYQERRSRSVGDDIQKPAQLDNLQKAERTYSELKSAYRSNAYPTEARKYNIREKEAERKRHFPFSAWLRNSALKWTMWYGESPKHVLKVGALTWFLFTIALLLIGFETPTGTIRFDPSGSFDPNALFSVMVLSFRRLLTFSNGSATLNGVAKPLAVFITGFGKFLEAIFIFALGRRAAS